MIGLLLSSAAVAEPALPRPAAEGTALIEALEAAPLGVVGTIEARTALDAHGWRAALVVESVLTGSAEPGQRIEIAWEELVRTRPPRFANGDRVLVALEPLVAGSLWRKRFGNPEALPWVRGIAQHGAAFLRRPALGSLAILQHYLRLPLDPSGASAGQHHLIALVAEAERSLALSAARCLAARPSGATLGSEDSERVLRALVRAESEPELESDLLLWVERTQPVGVIPALDAALAAPAGAPATFVRARGLLADGLPREAERALLASPAPSLRAAAAAVAGPAQTERLVELLRRDPAPEVRRAALQRLARLEGAACLEALLDAFDDADASVRQESALHVAAFGSAAVARLHEAARWPWPTSESAVLALSYAKGEAARAALEELASQHPDPRIRLLAEVALGRSVGHKD